MIDIEKIEKIIAAMSVSMEAMNASHAEATYVFAFLHKDAMKRFMVEKVWDQCASQPKNVINATSMSQHIDKAFEHMGFSIDEFAEKMVGPHEFSEGVFYIDPDTDLHH